MSEIISAIPSVFNWQTILGMVAGNAVGIVFGAIPGFTGVMAIAILLPFTFSLNTTTGIVMLFSCFCGGCFGGSITAILIGTPGAPEAAPTVFDGYPLALKGKSGKAITIAAISSCIGGMISSILLLLFSPTVAKWTLNFAPPEYFMLGIFGISVIAGLNEGNLIIGIISGIVGVMLSLIGMDAQSGVTRFTFGNLHLYSGLNLSPIILGVFALNRIFKSFSAKGSGQDSQHVKLSRDRLSFKEFRSCGGSIMRGTVVGSIIGAIPAAGAAIASFISYNLEKVFCRNREKLGSGIIEGVAAPEAANNAVTGTSLIPLLTLGIPGSGGAATLLGAFMMHGLSPGPFLFKNNGQTIYAIILGFIITNLVMLLVVKVFLGGFVQVSRIPETALVSVLFVICFAGAFCNSTSVFDVLVAVITGVVAYLLTTLGVPMIPMILGFILGPTIEKNFRNALIMSDGSYLIFIRRPICIILIMLTVIMIIGTKYMNRAVNRASKKT